MRVLDSLGQLRTGGEIPTMYSHYSERPYPYYSEDELIRMGLLDQLRPVYGNTPWPSTVPPPEVPSLEREVYAIRRGEQQLLWPWAGTWAANWIDRVEPAVDGLGDPDTRTVIGGAAIVLGAGLGAFGLYKGNYLLAAAGGLMAVTAALKMAGAAQ